VADVTARHRRGPLDTSVVILRTSLDDPDLLPYQPEISAVTLAELALGPLVARSEAQRRERQAHLRQAEIDFDPLPFDADAARAFAGVATRLRRAGRKPGSRSYDALIAATAIANALPLYTANPADVAGIDDLEVVEVGAT
jgi:predicted nucleic acid-binding protein